MRFTCRASAEHRDEARELLREQLEAASYPLQDIEVIEDEDDEIEFVATLLGTGADPDELDEIVKRLKAIRWCRMRAGACGRRNNARPPSLSLTNARSLLEATLRPIRTLSQAALIVSTRSVLNPQCPPIAQRPAAFRPLAKFAMLSPQLCEGR